MEGVLRRQNRVERVDKVPAGNNWIEM
jgi:hypothetical protein